MKCKISVVASVCVLMLSVLFVHPSRAHHVLGRPAYSLSEDSNTPPSMQMEAQVGQYLVTMMAFPAFLQPNEAGRIHLYASPLPGAEPLMNPVLFSARSAGVWRRADWQVLGEQKKIDDHVYRQSVQFHAVGDYLIRADFFANGEDHIVDFPIRVGAAPMIGPVGIIFVSVILFLICISLFYFRRLNLAKVKLARDHNIQSHPDA
jgi:hypothetical protein